MERLHSCRDRIMEKEKIKLTKELVISIYKRSYFRSHFARILFLSIYMIAFVLWYDDLSMLFLYTAPNLEFLVDVVIVFPVCALVAVIDLISQIIERRRVLKGDFFITTDKIVRRQGARSSPKIQYNRSHNFKFKNYGCHWIGKVMYSPIEKRFITGKEQLNRAYLGDIYYIAVTNKNKKIIAIFDTDNYSEFVTLIPLASCMDREFDFGMIEVSVNPRSSVKEFIPSQYTHPQDVGYLQIADVIYSAYCEKLSYGKCYR